MRLTRRNALIGMGTVAAGAGVIGGTGAFTSVTAERTVSVETTSDGGAALALEPVPNSGNSDYVDEGDDTIAINLDSTDAGGFNKNATTILQNLIRVTNNGTQSVGSLTLGFDLTNISFSNGNPFKFTVSAADGSPADDEKNTVADGSNILIGNNSLPSSLGVGEAVDFGLVIDLIGNGNSSNGLPSQPNGYTLTISAEANPQN